MNYETLCSQEFFPGAYPEDLDLTPADKNYSNSAKKGSEAAIVEEMLIGSAAKNATNSASLNDSHGEIIDISPLSEDNKDYTIFDTKELRKIRFDLKPMLSAELESYQYGKQTRPMHAIPPAVSVVEKSPTRTISLKLPKIEPAGKSKT